MPKPSLLPAPPLSWAADRQPQEALARNRWPLAQHSQFVAAAGLCWHVQRFGDAPLPTVLLLHGTGASTHTWRHLVPLLVPHYQVLALDLPGHAFTSAAPPTQQSLVGMAAAVAELLKALQVQPRYAIGHSAGAAVIAQLLATGAVQLDAWASINGAILPLRGLPGRVFAPVAELLAATPGVPQFFSWRAGSPRVLQRLLASTGSRVDAEGQRLYGLLVGNAAHAAGALGMMARWNLPSLEPLLPGLRPAPLLLAGLNDTTVPPVESTRVAARIPGARVIELPGLGHLAHEEDAAAVWRVLEEAWA
jgi:magnesium chelatase accessory protein